MSLALAVNQLSSSFAQEELESELAAASQTHC
jgi:hypothetical protein